MKEPYLFPGWKRVDAYRFFLFLGVALVLGASLLFTQLLASAAGVRQETLRLHILANSDSPEDQALKLQVRDEILDQVGEFLAGAQSRDQAVERVKEAIPQIQEAADRVLERENSDQQAVITLEQYRFPTTQYEGFTLPAGEYLALRVILGEGKGHNWFCCLYPGLCLEASGAQYDTPEENDLVFGDYVLRFAAIQWWEDFWDSRT